MEEGSSAQPAPRHGARHAGRAERRQPRQGLDVWPRYFPDWIVLNIRVVPVIG